MKCTSRARSTELCRRGTSSSQDLLDLKSVSKHRSRCRKVTPPAEARLGCFQWHVLGGVHRSFKPRQASRGQETQEYYAYYAYYVYIPMLHLCKASSSVSAGDLLRVRFGFRPASCIGTRGASASHMLLAAFEESFPSFKEISSAVGPRGSKRCREEFRRCAAKDGKSVGAWSKRRGCGAHEAAAPKFQRLGETAGLGHMLRPLGQGRQGHHVPRVPRGLQPHARPKLFPPDRDLRHGHHVSVRLPRTAHRLTT